MSGLRGIPVLTYHAVHVDGTEYSNNDHIGLASDLEQIDMLGWRIVPATLAVHACLRRDWSALPQKPLVLTFDDGSDFDWSDLVHPAHGPQRGFAGILRDFRRRHGAQAQPALHATSFVIVSPSAREVLDRDCLIGQGWWGDDWWPQARREGLIGIANHSWDHRHAVIPPELRHGDDYGHFTTVSDPAEGDFQIRQAMEFLHERLGATPEPLFAYPYGDVPEFLAADYLPGHGESMGLQAAFSTEPAPMTEACDRWRMPRFTFRRDWTTPDQLRHLLSDCG